MFEVLFIDPSGFKFLLVEGLDLVNAGKIVLQLAVKFAHFPLRDAEEGRTLPAKINPEIRIRGMGAQVIKARVGLIVSKTISTPAKVTILVMVSGIM